MKKNIIAYLLPALLFAISACEVDNPEQYTINNGGQKATFTFTPQFLDPDSDEPGTKAFADNPTIHNIFFAVFDQTGYKLSEYAEAVPNSKANVNGSKFKYSVELTISNEPRIIHIIANAPKRLVYGSEAEVIGALKTFINAPDPDADEGEWKEAYWTRLVLPGVWEEPNEDKHGMVGTPGYEAQNSKYQSVVTVLNSAELVRNFARIVVDDEGATNFTLQGIWLTNYPDLGSVAPYNRTTGNFEIDYGSYKTVEDMMTRGRYVGYTPASANIVKITSAAPMVGAALNSAGTNVAETFCYEREKPTADPLYIIVKGRYSGAGAKGVDSYYKIDLRDENNEYFPVLRNFSYRVHINSVANDGAATLADALSGPPSSGDVSTSLEMQELTNISNGDSQLFVSQTSALVVGTDDVYLRYKYIPKLEGATAGDVKNDTDPADDGYVTITSSSGDTGDAFSSYEVEEEDEDDDYRVITLHPNTPDALYKDQTFTITGKYCINPMTDGQPTPDENKVWETITRTVEYRLREKLNMTLSCTPTVSSAPESAIEVTIGLEAGLPPSIFSLNFNIEAEHLGLTTYPGAAIPVKTDRSTIPANSGKPSYYFVKTITWQDYVGAAIVDGYKYFTIRFKTNKAFTGGEGDNIYVSNDYYNQRHCGFTTKQILISQSFAGTYYETNGHLHESENLSFKVVTGSGVQLKKLTYRGTEYTNGDIIDSGNDTYIVNTNVKPTYGVNWNTGNITIQLQDNGNNYDYSYSLEKDVWREEFQTLRFTSDNDRDDDTGNGYIRYENEKPVCGVTMDTNNIGTEYKWLIEKEEGIYRIRKVETDSYLPNATATGVFNSLSTKATAAQVTFTTYNENKGVYGIQFGTTQVSGRYLYLNRHGGSGSNNVGVYNQNANNDAGSRVEIKTYPSNPRSASPANWAP